MSRNPFFRCVVCVAALLLAGWLGSTMFAQASAPQATDAAQKKQSKDILAHLNAVLHFYRSATAFTQKVGEPSDALYHDEAITLSTQIAQLAFQSAKAEATLQNDEKIQAESAGGAAAPASDASAQQKKMDDLVTSTHAQIAQLNTSIATLDHQISIAPPAKMAALIAQRDNLQGQLDLIQSMHEALDKYQTFANANAATTSPLGADIARLEQSAPILSPLASMAGSRSSRMATAAHNTPATQLQQVSALTYESINTAEAGGVLGQAEAVFSQLSNLRQIYGWMKENDELRARAAQLHAPLVALLHQTLQQGQALAQNSAPAPAPAPTLKVAHPQNSKVKTAQPATPPPVAALQDYEQLAKRFQQISAASLPLSQEILLLDQSHANLQQWSDSIDRESDILLRALLIHILLIALAIGLVFFFGEVWRRASVKYVHDLRRRRQLLIIRRFTVGFFMGIVLISGFVSQISSLATFAGFLTAGIAVGLQTVLLSVAAYFFIVGRYGVRVGDRISVAGVTGDVMEVGLVRMYVMELAGTGIDLYPTGRVAVFSNAVLFQATTPLYKQIPGTEYGWREVAVKLNDAEDFKGAAEKMTALVTNLYQKYQPEIERQHGSLALHWDISAEVPKIESRLQYVDGGLEFKVRYPVLLRHAAESDEAVTRALLTLSQSDAAFQSAVQGPPILRTTVKT